MASGEGEQHPMAAAPRQGRPCHRRRLAPGRPAGTLGRARRRSAAVLHSTDSACGCGGWDAHGLGWAWRAGCSRRPWLALPCWRWLSAQTLRRLGDLHVVCVWVGMRCIRTSCYQCPAAAAETEAGTGGGNGGGRRRRAVSSAAHPPASCRSQPGRGLTQVPAAAVWRWPVRLACRKRVESLWALCLEAEELRPAASRSSQEKVRADR